jgi:hypothetical protein
LFPYLFPSAGCLNSIFNAQIYTFWGNRWGEFLGFVSLCIRGCLYTDVCAKTVGEIMTETVMLKITKKGDKGFQVSSVPVQKLQKLANDKHRYWSLEGDFLVLRSY